jgi:ABC-2 type transport system ATP-binding protein
MSDDTVAAARDAVIQARGILKRYGGEPVLRDLDLTIAPGGVYGLVGRNGAGKTTLLRILLGLLPYDGGTAVVLGRGPDRLDATDFARIGYHAHGLQLFGGLSLAEHAAYFSPGYPTWDPEYARRLARDLEVAWSTPVNKLSSGDAQKAGLVLALAHRPELLVLDEPAANLDVTVRRAVIELLVDHVADGEATVVIASHLLTDLERIADRIGFLAGGRILLERPLDRLKESVVKLRLTFPKAAPVDLCVPHELCRETGPREIVATVSDVDEPFLESLGPDVSRETVPLGLEDIFIAVTSHAERLEGGGA